MPRQLLPSRRAQVTHKIRVGHRRTLYLNTQASHERRFVLGEAHRKARS
jgi:hypothetical protein